MSPSDPARGLVIEHQRDAPPGRFADWASRRGIELAVAHLDAGDGFPPPGDYDFALVLGSEASLAEEPPAWADEELDWLRKLDAAAVPVMGICFGAQALASALGGHVERSETPEIGWITTVAKPGAGVPAGPWFTWHEDRFTLPPGAVELGRSAGCTQAFALRSHMAVQFHPEVTEEIVAGWMRHDGRQDVLDARPGVLTRPGNGDAQRLADELFDAFLRRAGL